jgi:hypothetical protein
MFYATLFVLWWSGIKIEFFSNLHFAFILGLYCTYTKLPFISMLGAAKSYIWSIAIIFCKTCSEKTKKNTKKTFCKKWVDNINKSDPPNKIAKTLPTEIKCLPKKQTSLFFCTSLSSCFFGPRKKNEKSSLLWRDKDGNRHPI